MKAFRVVHVALLCQALWLESCYGNPGLGSALVRYTMTAQACAESKFENSAVSGDKTSQRLIRNAKSTLCDRSMGVTQENQNYQGFALQSEGIGSDILGAFASNANGISFELWFKPDAAVSSTRKRPILTIGLRDDSDSGRTESTTDGLTACDRESFDFQLSQIGAYLQIAYRTSDPFSEPCQVQRVENFPALVEGELAHVVISLADRHQQVILNGRTSVSLHEKFSNDISHWNSQWGLSLMGYALPTPTVWRGTVYQLSLYPDALSIVHAKELISEGLPPAVPLSINTQIRVNEDAEIIAGSHPAEWYLQEASLLDTDRIELPYTSLNKEVEALQQKLNLISTKDLPQVFYFVTRLPSLGRLVQVDGRAFDPSDFETSGFAPISSSDGRLIYVPPLHRHSDLSREIQGFAKFSYCVSSAPIMNPAQCNSSTVTVNVEPVNDPPIADTVGLIIQQEGNNTFALPKILLSGTDVDIGDSIRAVQITRPPSYGHLQLSVTSFRQDGVRHGTMLADMNFTVPTLDPVYVNYIWWPNGKGPVVQGLTAQDSFRFRVQDQSGSWSLEETVEIKVQPSLEAKVQPVVVVKEDSTDTDEVRLFGVDTSGYRRRIGFFVEGVPSVDEGELLLQSTSASVLAGALLVDDFNQHPYSEGVGMAFVPTPDYCSRGLDGVTLDDIAIHFRVVAFPPDLSSTTIVSASEVFVQNITVECALDTLVFEAPPGPFAIKQATLRQAQIEPCLGSTSSDSAPTCDASAFLNGIEVKSRDRRIREATVTILAGKGFVSFNKESWDFVRASSGRRAITSGNITFRAYPEDLSKIFENFHFQSSSLGNDAITIFILYGDCPFVSVDESSSAFYTPTCQLLRQSIDIQVTEDKEGYHGSKGTWGDEGFPWQIMLCLLGYPSFYFVFVLLEIVIEGPPDDDDTTCTHQDDALLWRQYRAENGDIYYENTETGETTWEAPVGEEFHAYVDDEGDEESISQAS